VLGLLAGLAGVALFTSSISRRVAVSAENAGRLGEGLPLAPTLCAGDEIGRVGVSHLRAEALLASRATELTAARDAAMQATRAKNSFLSRTSHELRTPLNSVLGFAQLLQLSELSAEDRDGVERILGAGRHLLALINELIDIARIESGDLGLSLEPVLVRPLIGECAQLMAPIAAARSIRIIQDCAHPALAVCTDRQRLAQVLVNLISNAVKYNHPAGVEVVARFLRTRPGAGLLSAASGRAGIACAVRDLPDIILLDLHLPDLPGEEVLNELKAEPATAAIPVIVLSAAASRGVIHRLLAGGAFAYPTKPVELAGLLGTCAAARAQDLQREAR
jgi:signal transduction histidine kinase